MCVQINFQSSYVCDSDDQPFQLMMLSEQLGMLFNTTVLFRTDATFSHQLFTWPRSPSLPDLGLRHSSFGNLVVLGSWEVTILMINLVETLDGHKALILENVFFKITADNPYCMKLKIFSLVPYTLFYLAIRLSKTFG